MQHSIYPPQALQVSRQTRSEACGIMGRGRLVSITLTVPLSYAHRDFPGAGRTTVGRKASPEETVCFNAKRQQDPTVMSDPLSPSLYTTGPCIVGTTIL